MDIGKLDTRIQLQHVTTAKDSYGQPIETWATTATLWAQKIDVVRAAVSLENQVDMENTKYVSRFIIRHRNDVDGKARIVCEGRTYLITQIASIGRLQGLEIVALSTDSNDYA